MSDTYDLVFHDGPCAGLERTGSALVPPPAHLACNNMVYNVYRIGDTDYLALPPGTDAPHIYTPPPEGPAQIADAGLLEAWHQLANGVNRDTPASVLKTRTIRNRIRAAGRRS